MHLLNVARVTRLALLVAAAGLSGCGHKQVPEAAQPKPALTVQVVNPSQESWPGHIAASGTVTPWQEAIIGTELTGVRLEEVRVNVGDVVSKGQLLARYDEASMRAQLSQLDAGIAEAQAAFEKARLDEESATQLEASGTLSRQETRAFRTQATVAEARLASARAQRDAQALRLRYAQVVAPDDGIISARTASVGAVASPGSELFRLIRGGRLEWRAEVRIDALPQLKHGMHATLQLPDGSRLVGTIRQVAPNVAPDTLNGIVYVDLPAHNSLTAGMFVSGEFELPTTPALAVPESVLVYRNSNIYVMQIVNGDLVREVKVQIGRRHGTDVEIVHGADAGMSLALSGGTFLNNGDLVRVVNP